MKKIAADIQQNNYKPVYLLCGDEVYLRKQFRDRLKAGILSGDDTNMNYSYFEGKQIDVNEIVQVSQTLPFFAERRLIVIENSGFFEKASEAMISVINELPETTFIVFAEEKIDKRSKFFKAVKEKGYVSELNTPNSEQLLSWAAGYFKRANFQISRDTLTYMLTKSGQDMENISNEIEKLICYAQGRDTITTADVDEVCVTQITKRIFDMVEAIARKDQKRALGLYADLLAMKEQPLTILALISRQFNQLLMVKELAAQGVRSDVIEEKVGMKSFVVNKCISQARAFSKETLREAIETCTEYDEAFKSGKMDDQLAVEMLIVKYSR